MSSSPPGPALFLTEIHNAKAQLSRCAGFSRRLSVTSAILPGPAVSVLGVCNRKRHGQFFAVSGHVVRTPILSEQGRAAA